MIPIGVEIFVARKPIDLRCSFDRLSGLVREEIGRDPRGQAMFLFVGRRRNALSLPFAPSRETGVAMPLKARRLVRAPVRAA
jgi:hypothetical protein